MVLFDSELRPTYVMPCLFVCLCLSLFNDASSYVYAIGLRLRIMEV